ncbi:MAG: glycosyltransferase, partial [Bifidobacteriaceae bacterium]|nr:glycosyltransferase [Bifidobacteriaceae bacterium]
MPNNPRIVLMPGNDALADARVMKNLRTAAELGYDAVALGISPGGAVREEMFEWGGRALIQPVPPRLESWRRYGPGGFLFDRTARSTGRDYAAHLRGDLDFPALRAARDRSREATVAAPRAPGRLLPWGRRLQAAWVRAWVKTRSVRADAELRRESWDGERLEAWRRRRFAVLRAIPWRARWRRALPQAVDRAMALAGPLDELDPDIVHVHDVYMMHVAAAYAARAQARGKPVRLVYDAREYVPGLAHVPPLRVEAYARLEAEYMRDFDRVVTVSEKMADLLVARHRLVRRPDIVLNAPMQDEAANVHSVRWAAGVPEGVPLLVYAGGVNPARGLGTVLGGIGQMDGVHLAVVTNTDGPAVRHLIAEAERLGVGDRLHLAPFVPHDQVTRYLERADVGVSPLSRAVNHDVTVTNKFCEYVCAGLPVLTSDTPAQAELVDELGLGGVFHADDARDFARAAREVLDRREELARRIRDDAALRRRFGWDTQA